MKVSNPSLPYYLTHNWQKRLGLAEDVASEKILCPAAADEIYHRMTLEISG